MGSQAAGVGRSGGTVPFHEWQLFPSPPPLSCSDLRSPGPRHCCYNYLCGPCGGGLAPSLVLDPPLPPASHGPGAFYSGKGFRKTMNSAYAIIYIVAASVMIVTVAFLVVVTA